MKKKLLDILCCPACLPREIPLTCEGGEETGKDIVNGRLRCGTCGAVYCVHEGIARLIHHSAALPDRGTSKYEDDRLLSAYLWSHYGDLLNDAEAAQAYRTWAEMVSRADGPLLDAGCAVGRLVFEQSSCCDLAVGVDLSEAFIRAARTFCCNRELSFDLVIEGRLSEKRSVCMPGHWQPEKTEFIVADATCLPFRRESFSCVTSLNVVDKVPLPRRHLAELDRAARQSGSTLLFSDPFSWSEDCTPQHEWLGGTEQGCSAGRGLHTVERLLTENNCVTSHPWTVKQRSAVWWKIRNHCNHFELICSETLLAHR